MQQRTTNTASDLQSMRRLDQYRLFRITAAALLVEHATGGDSVKHVNFGGRRRDVCQWR
jgi:hypothetical protein